MSKYLSLSLLVTLLLVVIVSAQIEPDVVLKRGVANNITVPCSNNNTKCTTAAQCDYTFFDDELANVKEGTVNASTTSFFQVPVNSTDIGVNGDYFLDMFCVEDSVGVTTTFNVRVTETGTDLTTGGSMIYLIMLAATIIFFLFTVWGFVRIPWRDNIGPDNVIEDVNGFKYVKIFLFFMAYLELLFIAKIVLDISSSYLFLGAIGGFFTAAYYALLVILFPLFLIVCVFTVKSWWNDAQVMRSIERGVPIRG